MAQVEPTLTNSTNQHLIVETVTTNGMLPSVTRSVKAYGVTVAGVGHTEIMRRVYTLVEAQDVYFNGRRLEAMPGLREAFWELVTPGQQLVSRPTGRFSVAHTYVGKRNILSARVMQRSAATAPAVVINYYGTDPAPERQLYGRDNVPFVEVNGEPLTGAAYYNSNTHRFQPVQNPDRRTLLGNFVRMFQNAAVPAG